MTLQLRSADRFLLISAKPAPNGGLHLGHLAGPYLRQDMLRRHYLSRGASVAVVGGTDPVDSFISLRATQDDRDPDQVAHGYFEQIRADFAAHDVELDAFIDPLSPTWRDRYVASFAEVLERAKANGRLRLETVPFPFRDNGSGASGAWVCGTCPDCGSGVSGYFCEDCGAHFDPAEIGAPVPRFPGQGLTFRPESDFFFHIAEPAARLASLARVGVPDDLREVVARQFRAGRDLVRLSEPSDWGIPLEPGSRRRYFGHGLLYGYCRLLGDLYREVTGEAGHPFDDGSPVTTVNLFGIDNTVSHMVNIQAIGEEVEGWKGFDGFVVNRFLRLEGRKISTSARHLVHAADLTGRCGLHSDGIRFALAASSPTRAEVDLHVDEFVRVYNEIFLGTVCRAVVDAVAELRDAPATAPTTAVAARFEEVFARVCDGHRFPVYDPAEQVATVLSWLAASPPAGDPDRYGRLKALSLLLYPIAPRLGRWAWRSLGAEGEPAYAAYAGSTVPRPDGPAPVPPPADPARLREAISAAAAG
ncbi:class I tRNA ligase family protein [Actinosynnema sp. NPDC047251]|uniref:Methionyl-tRNA synthetase n=1 Tax=Saccharothrix espanaensis (strain ATCC 51144 / DSM 44229 / JCM 9112 / NBRC 15066 / NRRL 15764) TaxID=1179773 RepID=K0K222_SACES|nr:class I tRNA ligase family protein [Saccharothrix espanaensis]CCH32401.1 Methionyl-tRNA synthetase [Saccharothrix espanaensis DSM 44229]